VKDFKLNISSLGWLVKELTNLITSNPNKSFRVKVVGWKESRSLSQNALYHKWLSEISKQAKIDGKEFSSEIWAEYFKNYYCPKKIIEMPAGKPVTVTTTTKLDTGEMHHYLTRIEAWAQQKGYLLTIPIDCEYLKLIEQQER